MNLEHHIALRYLFGRKQRSLVTVISWISLIGLLVSTAAMIVVLSVYNGIGNLTKSLFGIFDPQLSVEPAQGKTFHTADIDYRALLARPDVEAVSEVVEETAWITYGNNQAIVQLRGVDSVYHRVSGLDTLLYEGDYPFAQPYAHLPDPAEPHYLLLGGEIYYSLAARLHSNHAATLLIPRRGTTSMGLTLDQAFNMAYAYPTGYFFLQQDIDRQYAVTDIGLVRRLMGYGPDEVTRLAIQLRPGTRPDKVKRQLAASFASLPQPLAVKDRLEQQPLYYKVFRTERLGIYLILALVVLISTLSLVASLSLLITGKQRDIFVLRSMGLTRRRLRRTFRAEGLLICAVATLGGLAVGFIVCLLQQQFGLVRMGDGNFVVDAFPVAMRAVDFLWVFLLVMSISAAAVSLTVQRARI